MHYVSTLKTKVDHASSTEAYNFSSQKTTVINEGRLVPEVSGKEQNIVKVGWYHKCHAKDATSIPAVFFFFIADFF